MLNPVRLIDMWRLPSAKVMAQRELEDARREFLAAQSTSEYAKQIAQYNDARIKRLTAYLKESE